MFWLRMNCSTWASIRRVGPRPPQVPFCRLRQSRKAV
jgi:hypothetical protein